MCSHLTAPRCTRTTESFSCFFFGFLPPKSNPIQSAVVLAGGSGKGLMEKPTSNDEPKISGVQMWTRGANASSSGIRANRSNLFSPLYSVQYSRVYILHCSGHRRIPFPACFCDFFGRFAHLGTTPPFFFRDSTSPSCRA